MATVSEFDEIMEHNPALDHLFNADHPLVKSVCSFLERTWTKGDIYIISLSGGVDSMVLAAILKSLETKYEIMVVAAHINYNNREETVLEQRFISKWSERMKIPLEIREITDLKRDSTERSTYERLTTDIRFKFYQDCLKKYGANAVFYGHHLDDVTENVICNFMRGRSVHHLVVMHDKTVKRKVMIYRPMIEHHKVDIFNYAHSQNVPYFKNTTPTWSNRYKIREQLLPLLQEIYGKNVDQKIIETAKKGERWATVIDVTTFKPFHEKTIISNTDDSIEIEINNVNSLLIYNTDVEVWYAYLTAVFNKVGQPQLSFKAVIMLLDKVMRMNISSVCRLDLKNTVDTVVIDNTIKFSFT